MAVMTVFHSFSKRLAGKCGLLLILGAGLGGCASATIDNAVPASAGSQAAMPAPAQPGGTAAAPAAQQSAAVIDKPVPPRSGAPVNTGAYPNINIVPEGVTNQLSNIDSVNLRNELYAEKAAQRMPGEPLEAYIARLRKLQLLGSTHAAAALKEIEASK
jgi:hypothetical protein